MSIIIKGMEMPKECNKCPLRNINLHDVWYESCSAAKPFPRGVPYTGKPDWCPCEDVPTPHGRLIEVDELVEFASKASFKTREDVIKVITSSPTIIEAEE